MLDYSIDDLFGSTAPQAFGTPDFVKNTQSSQNSSTEGIDPSVIAAGDVVNVLNFLAYSSDGNGMVFKKGSGASYEEGGNISFSSVSAPTACVAALVSTASGNVEAGNRRYKITFVTSNGQTELGAISNTVVTDATHKQVTLSGIPVSTSSAVTSRKVYRTNASTGNYQLVNTIADNLTTTFTDNYADSSLSSTIFNNIENTSFGKIKVDSSTRYSVGNRNIFIGEGAGNPTVASVPNIGIGYNALHALTQGSTNVAVGESALGNLTGGGDNVAVGYGAMAASISGSQNVAMGEAALFSATSNNNVAVGFDCLLSTTTGGSNTAVGTDALFSNVTGARNIAMGYFAGYYETGSDAFYVDNQDRTNTAGDKANAILYGVMAAAAASQYLTVNGRLNVSVSHTPSSASDTGTAGEIAWDANYIYVCTATNTWKRIAIATW